MAAAPSAHLARKTGSAHLPPCTRCCEEGYRDAQGHKIASEHNGFLADEARPPESSPPPPGPSRMLPRLTSPPLHPLSVDEAAVARGEGRSVGAKTCFQAHCNKKRCPSARPVRAAARDEHGL